MGLIKKALPALLVVFIAIQFIQPAHNKSGQVLPTDFVKLYNVPNSVQSILQNACYDCHSNNTRYPWYSNIQPVAWMMASHIRNGKKNLNFSAFGSYGSRRQISKLKNIANQIQDNKMPLVSYKLIHKKARLTKEEKTLLMNWMNNTADSLLSN
ncbi:heme-binding domain-containing protein [Hydrotalea sp.]|uniref:heme-binding domain-containing protein n=1 Tax=Hydrotalea sp. TaxID=2881279 RepID=UPI00260D9475|nr:heme-binding domain-containing protein [Hydrotalea sp.]